MGNDLTKEKDYLNILRILAMYLVMLNHRPIYMYALNTSDNVLLVISVLISIIIKCGPPLFFIISGILLLPKDESILYIFKHRIVIILLVMFACSIWQNRTNLGFYSIVYSLLFKLNWYFYFYIGYLILLPFLRKLIHSLDNKYKKYLYILIILYYLMAWVIYMVDVSESIFRGLFRLTVNNDPSIIWFIIFPIIGYLIVDSYEKENNKIKVVIKNVCYSILTLMYGIYASSMEAINLNGERFEVINQYSIIFVTQLFVILAIFCNGIVIRSKIIKQCISNLSKATFVMFVIETNTGYTQKVCNIMICFLQDFFPSYVLYLLGTFLALMVGLFTITILKRIIRSTTKLIKYNRKSHLK